MSRDIWLCAMLVAELRMAVNDTFRAPTRDRGAGKNRLGDLQGAIGELLTAAYVERHFHGATVIHDLVDFTGPSSEVDIRICANGNELRLEVKCLLWEPGKRRFLINRIAHERSIERAANAYFPVLATPGGSIAIVGPMIPIESIETWPIEDLGYGDPAHSISLDAFCARYLRVRWSKVRDAYLQPTCEQAIERSTLLTALPADVRRRADHFRTLLERQHNGVSALISSVGAEFGASSCDVST